MSLGMLLVRDEELRSIVVGPSGSNARGEVNTSTLQGEPKHPLPGFLITLYIEVLGCQDSVQDMPPYSPFQSKQKP